MGAMLLRILFLGLPFMYIIWRGIARPYSVDDRPSVVLFSSTGQEYTMPALGECVRMEDMMSDNVLAWPMSRAGLP